MEAEIKKLTAAITQMAIKSNNGKSINPNTSSSDHDSRRPQNKRQRNMGGYCHSHSYHPVGAKHTSANCSWKKDGHKYEATWTNTLGGDTFWPSAKRIAINQQNHATWKGKLAPTNCQGPGTVLYIEVDTNSAAFNKIKKKLSSNFYYCLSPPTC
jgi:hypothetical protein